ncbi:MAG: tRNA pseudouridine(38-40) synthase TruA [Panacagrimonas sp.]
MGRWVAAVEYDGGGYAGWQTQRHAPSVQAAVEVALSKVADHAVETVAAGRTDAGVHGHRQIIHFDSSAARSGHAWLLGANTSLPPDVSLCWVREAPADFHARFSALARRYRYFIHNSRARPALFAGRAAWVAWDLDAAAMHRAAQALVGEQDFSAFRDAECQSRTPMRRVTDVAVRREGSFVLIDIRANAFLHHMVRNIAGTLMDVGSGKRPEDWVAQVLAGRDRTRAGYNAPACGLYFINAEYPERFGLPDPPPFWFPLAFGNGPAC